MLKLCKLEILPSKFLKKTFYSLICPLYMFSTCYCKPWRTKGKDLKLLYSPSDNGPSKKVAVD